MSNGREHHTTRSELGFTVSDKDLEIVNLYPGDWVLSGRGEMPNNFWAVTLDGEGVPVPGHYSPRQIMDEVNDRGLHCAYVAPYGRYVEGKEDGVRLNDWLRDHKDRM